jgi:hypothetical protein
MRFAVLAVDLGEEDVGTDADDEWTEGWETGADDGYAGFNEGPVCCCGVVFCESY